MNWQIVEIIDKLVEVTLREHRGGFQLHVDEETTKITLAIYDADPRAKNKSCTLRRYWPGELKWCHRVHRWIFDALPYLARQLLVFYRLPTDGYTQGDKF
jgi:hypothetical protein